MIDVWSDSLRVVNIDEGKLLALAAVPNHRRCVILIRIFLIH